MSRKPLLKPSNRLLRVGENLRKAISYKFQVYNFQEEILNNSTILVTEVRVSKDLANAKVYVTTLGGKDNSEILIEALNIEFKKLIGPLTRDMKLRKTPKLRFILDDSYERQTHIDTLIKTAKLNLRTTNQ